MDADLWKQVDALLDAALDMPEHEREQFVARAAAGNPALQGEVLSLLRAESQASQFMERSAMKVAAQGLAQDSQLTAHHSLIGKKIGDYTIESLLGWGGMGEVYLALDVKLDRRVALKILPRHFVAEAERAARFKREALALSALNHPNLVTVYEVGKAGGLHYIAMEFVEGQLLRSMMRDGLKLKNSLSIAGQVAEALTAAHRQGIIHRDIKPDNIMVRPDAYVKLLDFGLAKLTEARAPLEADAAQTQAGAAMGTLAYMSPEQAAGEATDQRTDIWSLGVVLYEMVTRRKPFDGDDRRVTVNAILSSQPDSARSFDPTLPAELDLILDKALEKDRDLRYQTAADFRADLRRLLRSLESGTGSARTGAIAKSTALTTSRARLALSVAAVVAVLAAASFVVWRFSQSRTATAPDWTRATHVQLTDQPGTEHFPTLAPDGESFVYASRVKGNWELFLQRVGGKNATLLTPDTPSDESQPAFSPDGDRIAFRSTREPAGIYVMEATGENVRLVAVGGHHPSWSPDGKEIAYSTVGRDMPNVRTTIPSAIWIVNLETGAKRLLTQSDALQPSWSPQGHRIAYWFMPRNMGRGDIATIPSGGGEPVVVTRDASRNWNPVWSPDGHFLYFASDRSGNMSFWRVAIEEETGRVLGEPEAVVLPSTFNRHLSFSRDGLRMLYVQTNQRSNIRAVAFDPKGEKAVGQPFWVTRGDRQISRPELSPDGRQFVMRVQRRSQDDIAIVNRDGTNWRDVTNDKFFDRYPRWSPDGKRIVFTSDRGGSYEIWTLNVEDTNMRQLTFGSESSASLPLWSPDGKQILYRSNMVNALIDVDKNWAEQTPQPLPRPEGEKHFVAWDWSPDGKKLAGTFSGDQLGIGYFSLTDRRFEKLADAERYPMWLSDSRRLIFATESRVYIADIFTKRVREVFNTGEEQIGSIGISNDDRLLYFSIQESESDIWLLDLRR
ncbi:MAG TPA: protein kinase [Pyrinomonadaceae bacterium]|nr:protein kinase [Pyrinomonadaceae bacterium]